MTTAGGGSPELHLTDVDGVPCVWVDAPGPCTGGLSLRVGLVDEPLPRRGVTHMLEHLALFGLDRPGEHSNGRVTGTALELHTTGTPDEVATFLTRAAAQLAAPPVGRLEDEKGVLRAESARRAPDVLTELLAWRWGTSTFGREVTPELGLFAMTPDDVLTWAGIYAARSNAVLWFTGPPPAGLEIALHDGVRQPLPDPYESPLPALPAHFRSASGIVGLHCLLPRSSAGVALASALRSRLIDDLRTARAAAYSPETDYQPLTGDVAALVAMSDAVEGRLPDVAAGLVGALMSLADPGRGPTAEDLAAHRRRIRTMVTAPDAPTGLVTSAAWDLLHGGRVLGIEDILADVEGLTLDDVHAAAVEAQRTALGQLPDTDPADPPWPAAPLSPSAPVTGGRTFLELGGSARLTVADDGVTLTSGSAHLTVRRDALAAVTRWDDGGRVLVGDDGVQIVVEPTCFRAGRQAVRLIDEAVPAEKAVPLGARAGDEIPRVPLLRRARRAVRLAGVAVGTLALAGLAIGVGIGSLTPALVIVGAMVGVRVWRAH